MKNRGFRPLTGIKVSERTKSRRLYRILSFRPLTGIKVSERKELYPYDEGIISFRPLTGIKVSEPHPWY